MYGDRSRLSGRWAPILAFLQIFITRFVTKAAGSHGYTCNRLNQHRHGTLCRLSIVLRRPVGSSLRLSGRRWVRLTQQVYVSLYCLKTKHRSVVFCIPDLRFRKRLGKRLLQRYHWISLPFACNSRDGLNYVKRGLLTVN